jgi:hypothetical protein
MYRAIATHDPHTTLGWGRTREDCENLILHWVANCAMAGVEPPTFEIKADPLNVDALRSFYNGSGIRESSFDERLQTDLETVTPAEPMLAALVQQTLENGLRAIILLRKLAANAEVDADAFWQDAEVEYGGRDNVPESIREACGKKYRLRQACMDLERSICTNGQSRFR